MKRLFFAVNIPSSLKEKIFENFSEKLPDGLRVVGKEKLHVTLRFLGNRDEEELTQILGQVFSFKQNRFKLNFKKIGNFGKKVLWLGIDEGKKELKELNKEINFLIGEKEDRVFSAHLTLARNKFLNDKKFVELVNELNKIDFDESFVVEKVDLMESKSGKYSVVKSWKLL